MNQLRRTLQVFRPDWPRIVLALVLLAAVTALSLIKPWPVAWLVDHVLAGRPWPGHGLFNWSSRPPTSQAALLAVLALALYLTHAGLNALLQYVLIHTGLRGHARIRRLVFDWLLRLSLRRLQGSQAGDIIYRATWDTHAFHTLFQQGAFGFLQSAASVVLMIVVMWRLNLPLTLAALGVVPPLMLLIQGFGRGLARRAAAAQGADSQVASLVQQAVANLPLTQSYTQEPREAERFARQTQASLDARRRQHGFEVLYLALVAALFAAGTAAIVWIGTREVVENRLTVGGLWVFLAYLAQLYEPLNQLSNVGSTIANARAGASRVLELLELPPDVPDRATNANAPAKATPVRRPAELEFQSVRFGYTPDRPVLRELSFAVPAGATVALVGPSGAGKTTLLQLVPRFYDPAAGGVRLNGTDLREIPLRELRQQVALVLQEPLLLAATIADNIAYGRPDATPAEIEAAARAAHAAEFIERLPQRYQSVVGDGAVRLSVGEKQRLNLARAFLKDAPVLLLDEPTSALDGASESLVLAGLRELRRGRTTLMVAHRLETIRDVDLVAVIIDGQLAEYGPPRELRTRGGYFARMTGDAP